MMTMMLTMFVHKIINIRLLEKTSVCNFTWLRMLAHSDIWLSFFLYFFFQKEGTFPISGENEAFAVDTHIRLL